VTKPRQRSKPNEEKTPSLGVNLKVLCTASEGLQPKKQRKALLLSLRDAGREFEGCRNYPSSFPFSQGLLKLNLEFETETITWLFQVLQESPLGSCYFPPCRKDKFKVQ